MSNEAPPSNGLVAGKYELLRMIGRGGMGSVWEGRHVSLSTRVAIKFIESEYTDNEEARKRFDNEARAAAALQSKHAIQIFDHGVTDDGKPYIVMELLVGEPLDKRLERARRLSPQETAVIVQQVCRALQKAHDHGIVHRDLKPENIFLVRSEEEEEVAKVLDFGIAKMKNPTQEQGVSSSTKTGAVLGTPYYMSPEQARGLRNVDHRTDLWSMGVIVFKCVTGTLPFEGESLGNLLVKICTSPIPVPSQRLPGLPPAFDAWFARALDRDPNRRFGSAQELADALAYACGVNLRRGPQISASAVPAYNTPAMVPAASGPATPYGVPAQSPSPYASPPPYGSGGTQPGYGAPGGPSATSAPFVATPAPPQRSSGLVVAAIGAAILGVGLGVFGVIKLSGAGESHTAGAAQVDTVNTAEPPTTTVTALVTAPPPPTVTPPPADTTTKPATTAKPAHTTKVQHRVKPPPPPATTTVKKPPPPPPPAHTTKKPPGGGDFGPGF